MKAKNFQKEILSILENSSSPVSGEKIAQLLNISRVAVWKNIKKLKEKGYPISSSKRGYSLQTTDYLTPSEIEKIFLKVKPDFLEKFYFYREITSTMDVAKNCGEKKESALIIAEIQTLGRGRLQRKWKSPQGGLWMSLVFKPPFSLKEIFILNFVSSLAVLYSIKKVTNIVCRLKWPNDILYKGKKLAGILLEIKAEIDGIHYAIVGIGINVNNEISSIEPGGVSIKEILGKEIRRAEILESFLFYFKKFLKLTGEDILKLWIENSDTPGSLVKVLTSEGELIGKCIGIEKDGALLLKTQTEEVKKIYSGDCIHLRNIYL